MNSFDYRLYQPVIISKNEKMRKKWDIEEDKGFINGIIKNRIYKVRNIDNRNGKALSYLGYIDEYINTIKSDMLQYKNHCYYNNCLNESSLFSMTPHTLQEIPKNDVFEGINKPKFIVKSPNDGLYFKKDNDYRAGLRHIMLSIRTKNGSLRSWKNVKRLLLHELSHTMCNHVTYREAGNHQEDFHRCENFLKKLSKDSPHLREIENRLLKHLFRTP